MVKALVTGASGFIGKALVPRLLAAGYDVSLLVRPGSLGDPQCARIEAHSSDWARAVRGRKFDLCFHLAWITTPGEYLVSQANESLAEDSLALAEALFSNGLEHMIGVGSGIEYAPYQKESCSESNTPVSPTYPYSIAKSRVRQGFYDIAAQTGASASWTRIFYAYGKGEHPQRTVTSFLRSLSAGQPLLLKSPDSIKDFVHRDDIVNALLHVSSHRGNGIVVNIGTGTGVKIRELAHLAAEITGADAGLIRDAEQAVEDPYGYHVADPAILASWGCEPRVEMRTAIEEMLADPFLASV